MLDYFLLEYDCTRELVERARSMARGDRSTTTTNTTSTTSNNSMNAGPSVMQQQQQQQPPPPPRSKRDRIVSAFKARIKPLQSHRLLDERERILALSQMPLKWKKRKKTTRAKKSTGEEGEQSEKSEDKNKDLGEELADVLFVLLCIANQTGINLQSSFDSKLKIKAKRDHKRHKNNPKLKL